MIIVFFTILSALYDKGKRFTNHIPRFIFRAIVVILVSYFSISNFFISFTQNTIIFYVLFDYILNILENRKWNYIGTVAIWDIKRRQIETAIPHFDLITKIILLILIIIIQ